MAWFTPFIIPAVMNAPQLLRGDIGGYAKNTAIQGGVNTAVGNIAPNFNMNPAPSYAPGFTPPVASNIAGNLIGPQSAQQGLLSGAGAYSGPTSMMQANLGSNLGAPLDVSTSNIMPSYMDTSTMPNLTARTDVPQVGNFNIGPDMGQTIKPEVTDVAKAGGYEETPLTTKVFEKVTDYVKEKPFEAAMLGMMGGGAIYEGLKEPERPIPQPTLGPKLGGGQVNVGSPLQVRRSTPRRGR